MAATASAGRPLPAQSALNWTRVPMVVPGPRSTMRRANPSRYTLQESTNGGGWVTLFDGNAGSYATPARGVGSYAYCVAACNGAGCGPWSGSAMVAVIGAPTIEPVISAPGLVNVPQYSFSWSVPANSESFILEESANGGGWTVVHNGGANSLVRTVARAVMPIVCVPATSRGAAPARGLRRLSSHFRRERPISIWPNG